VVSVGNTPKRLGKMAGLFDDHSPLQLQASGSWRDQAFTLLWRLLQKQRGHADRVVRGIRRRQQRV
jgi:hypothetical protein